MSAVEGQTQAQPSQQLRKLGKYDLIARIGEGGMAEVFLARQRGPMNFQKVVVVKTIHPDLTSQQEFLAMLLDEARLSALIKHPRVVDIYELGQAGETFFIVMEHLEGQPLSRLMAAASGGFPLEPSSVARIIGDAAEGLHAAHELKSLSGRALELVHRDVSPGNIMVLYDGTVKVLDFGVAKARGRLTSSGVRQLKGKLGYMAPEQLAGRGVDRRSDIYSLGVVLWETLVAKRLFPADSYQKVADTMVQQIDPPSLHRPQVPPALDEICLRALAVDPDARYQTAGEMKAAIDDFLIDSGCHREHEVIAAHMGRLFARQRNDRRALLSRRLSTSMEMQALDLPAERARGTEPPPLFPAQGTGPGADAAVGAGATEPTEPMPRAPRRRWPLLAAGALGAAGLLVTLLVASGGDSPAAAMEQPPPAADLAKRAAAEPLDPPQPAETPSAPEPEAEEAADVETLDAQNQAQPDAKPKKKPKKDATPDKPTTAGKSAAELYSEGADLFVRGDHTAAKSRFKAAIAADPRHAPAYRGLGLVYQAQGRKDRAIASYKKYLALAPGAADAASIRQRIETLEK